MKGYAVCGMTGTSQNPTEKDAPNHVFPSSLLDL